MPVSQRPDNMPPRSPAPGQGPDQSWRWIWGVLIIAVLAVLVVPSLLPHSSAKSMGYQQYLGYVKAKEVRTATIDNTTGVITGKLTNGQSYTVTGPHPASQTTVALLRKDSVSVDYSNPPSNLWGDFLPYILFIGIAVILMVFISRQARGQMSGIMSIGRSKARLFSSDRPTTTFQDVAGYNGVKQEISEVVDFLRTPARFRDIGAKIPKGVLLVGPPGTGKTLLARAVAGEAGVPFLSVTGSDFMEMFVGVGASRVRDLFQTARKQAPAIIFVDEIDCRAYALAPAVDLEDRQPLLEVGQRHHDLAVEASGAQQCRVQDVGPVGGGDDDHALGRVEAVHLAQHLVQGLLALVVAATEAGAALAPDGVDLVHEDDGRCLLARRLEQVTHPRGADADEHLHEVRARDR